MATSSLFCSKRLLILCFAEKKENATHSQLSSEIPSGEKPSLYYLIYFSCLRSSLFSISLSPSIVNSSCKLSKSTILLKKIFKFNFQVSASLDSTYQCCVCISSVFFFFSFSAAMVDPFFCEQYTYALFTDPTNSIFNQLFH